MRSAVLPVQCGCAAAIRAFLPPHSLLQLPSAPKAGGSCARCHSLRRLFLRSLRTQGRRSAAARRVPPTTHRSCRRVPPAAWPASPGGGAGWALRQAPVQTARNQSHRGIGRQAGVTTPVKQVPLSPSCQCHYPRQAKATIGKLKRILLFEKTDTFFACCFRTGHFSWGISR